MIMVMKICHPREQPQPCLNRSPFCGRPHEELASWADQDVVLKHSLNVGLSPPLSVAQRKTLHAVVFAVEITISPSAALHYHRLKSDHLNMWYEHDSADIQTKLVGMPVDKICRREWDVKGFALQTGKYLLIFEGDHALQSLLSVTGALLRKIHTSSIVLLDEKRRHSYAAATFNVDFGMLGHHTGLVNRPLNELLSAKKTAFVQADTFLDSVPAPERGSWVVQLEVKRILESNAPRLEELANDVLNGLAAEQSLGQERMLPEFDILAASSVDGETW